MKTKQQKKCLGNKTTPPSGKGPKKVVNKP